MGTADYCLAVKHGGIGDCLIASALVRDLVALRPDIRLSVEGSGAADIFARHPNIAPAGPDTKRVVLDYRPVVDRARTDRSARYVYAPHEAFEAATGIAVPRGRPAPEIVVGADEARPRPRPYAVVASGTKGDMPVKSWVHAHFRDVVAAHPEYEWLQVGAILDARHMHRQTAIPGCVNLLGKTGLRDLFLLVRGAAVVLCHVSLPMLVAAAFGVPCVAVAGGREDPWLHADSGVRYVDTVGALPCCAAAGCRCSVALAGHADSGFPPGWACTDPVDAGGQWVGRCMTLITPDQIKREIKISLGAAS